MPKAPLDLFRPPDDPAEIGRAWQSHLSPVFDISFGRDSDLTSAPRMITAGLGSILCGTVAAPAQQLRRAPRMIARQGVDHILFQFYTSGSSQVDVGRHRSETRTSQILVADLSQPIVTQAAAVSAVNLMVPRGLLADRAGRIEDLHGKALDIAADPARRLLCLYMSELVAHLDHVEASQAGHLSSAAVEMVRACFEPDAAPPTATHRLRKITIKRFIEAEIGSHGLDVAALIGRFGMSRAKLHRMFEEEGGVGAYIRERRLLHARRMLTEPGAEGPLSMSAIAYATGFPDLSGFSRAFKRRFGSSPTEAARAEDFQGPEGAASHLLTSWMLGLAD